MQQRINLMYSEKRLTNIYISTHIIVNFLIFDLYGPNPLLKPVKKTRITKLIVIIIRKKRFSSWIYDILNVQKKIEM